MLAFVATIALVPQQSQGTNGLKLQPDSLFELFSTPLTFCVISHR